MEILTFIIISSLFSLGLAIYSEEGEPFEFFHSFAEKLASKHIIIEHILTPVILCYRCMGWLYATLIFLTMKVSGEIEIAWLWLAVIALCTSALNYIIGKNYLEW